MMGIATKGVSIEFDLRPKLEGPGSNIHNEVFPCKQP